jgi:hypothetical protein
MLTSVAAWSRYQRLDAQVLTTDYVHGVRRCAAPLIIRRHVAQRWCCS